MHEDILHIPQSRTTAFIGRNNNNYSSL